jgi:hypothetical protein
MIVQGGNCCAVPSKDVDGILIEWRCGRMVVAAEEEMKCLREAFKTDCENTTRKQFWDTTRTCWTQLEALGAFPYESLPFLGGCRCLCTPTEPSNCRLCCDAGRDLS